jgi:hypothetical protein
VRCFWSNHFSVRVLFSPQSLLCEQFYTRWADIFPHPKKQPPSPPLPKNNPQNPPAPQALAEQIAIVQRGLDVFAARCPENLQPLLQHLVDFFAKMREGLGPMMPDRLPADE